MINMLVIDIETHHSIFLFNTLNRNKVYYGLVFGT